VRMQFNAQATHYRGLWPASRHSVIEVRLPDAVQPVGRLWVDQRADTIHVLDIAVLPEWRGRGIGRECFRRLMSEAAQVGRALSIQVEQGNPARRLYDSLGFLPVGAQQGLHQKMVWCHDANTDSIREEACDEQA
jgi:ribosomal protein S18 acetylase RimI-like enzyme